jgi:ParB-like chromosome segregation protein Spo0J
MELTMWKTKKVKLKDIQPMGNNPRSIAEKALKGLKKSIERFGYVEPIIWNKTTNHIIGGHQRYGVLLEEGVEEAIVVVVEMTKLEEMAANITLNNPEIEGEWDNPLNELLAQVEDADKELFEALNMDKLKSKIDEQTPEGDETDTTCPCCSHEWKIEASDVTVEIPEDENTSS